MSHYDFNSDDKSRKNIKGDVQQPNTEDSELKFEENEVQFIPVDLHDEKPSFKYSGNLSKPESEKYYSNAELRTIQKFNSLFNKVVVLPSNTLCGRTGTSFSNGDYGDVSVKEEFWKTTEEELVHYEMNSDQNVEKADHCSSECHNSHRKRKSNKITANEQEQHRNIEKDFLRKTVIFRKLKTSSYLRKYTSFLREIYENNFSHYEGCNLKMMETELTKKRELIIMDNMYKNSVKSVLSVTRNDHVKKSNECIFIYPISTSNNGGLNDKYSSETCNLDIAHEGNNLRRVLDVVQEKKIKIESYKTANHWNYSKPGASRGNDLNLLKSDIKMKRSQNLENFTDINFSEVNFRKIYLKSPEQYTYIVKNISVVETDLTKSNEILKLSYSSRLASALKRSSKTSSKSLVASQGTEEQSLKSKENVTMKQASILIIKKLFGRKHSKVPPCDCRDKQNITGQSEPTECVIKKPQDSMQQISRKQIEAETFTNGAKKTEREQKIQQLIEKISANRSIDEKFPEQNTESRATSQTSRPQNTMDVYQKEVQQPSAQDKIQREQRINELVRSMSSKYAHTKILKAPQQNTDKITTIPGRKISEQHDQDDKRKQREMRLQKLIDEMRRKQKCVCDPCEKKINEYTFTDFEMCKCLSESLTSKEKLSEENFTGANSGDGKTMFDIGSKKLDEEFSESKPEKFLENQQEFGDELRQSDHKPEADMNFNEDETSSFTRSEKGSLAESNEKLSMQNSDDLSMCDKGENNVEIDKDHHNSIVGETTLSNTEVVASDQFSDEQKTESESQIPTSSSIIENGKDSPHISIAVKVVMDAETVGENGIPRDLPKLDALTEEGETSNESFQRTDQSKRPISNEKDDIINGTTRNELITPLSDTSTEDDKVSNGQPRRHKTDKKLDKFSDLPESSTTDNLPESSDTEVAIEKPKRPTIEKRIGTFSVPPEDEVVIEKPKKPTTKNKMKESPEVSDEELQREKPRKPVADKKMDELFRPSDEEFEIEKPGRPTTEKKMDELSEYQQEVIKEKPEIDETETTDQKPETYVDIDNGEYSRKEQLDSKQKEHEFLVEGQILKSQDSESHFHKSSSEIGSSAGSLGAGTLKLKVEMKTTHSKSNDVLEQRNEVEDMKSFTIEKEEKKIVQDLTTPPGKDDLGKTKLSDRPEFGSSIRFTSKVDENGDLTQQLSVSLSGSDKIGKSRSSDLPDLLSSSNDPRRTEKRGEKLQEPASLFDDKYNIEQESVHDIPAELPGPFPRKIEEKEGKFRKLSFIGDDNDFFERKRSTDQPDFKSTLPKSKREGENIRSNQRKGADITIAEKRGKVGEPDAGPEGKMKIKDKSKKKPYHGKEIPEKTTDGKKIKKKTGETGPKSDQEEKIRPHTKDKEQNTDITQPKYRRHSKTPKTKYDEKSKTQKENIGHIRSDSRNENIRQSHDPYSDRLKVSGIKPPRKLSLKAGKISEKPEYNADALSDSKRRKTDKESGVISGMVKTKHIIKKRRKSSDQYSFDGDDLMYEHDTKEEVIKSSDKSKRRRKSSEEYSPRRMSFQKGTDEDMMKAEYESKIRRKSSEKYSGKDVELKPLDETHRKLTDKSDGRRKSSAIYPLKRIKLRRESDTIEDGVKTFDKPKRRRILSEQYSPDRGDFRDEELLHKLKQNIYEDEESDIKGRRKLYKRSTDYSGDEAKMLKDIRDASTKYGHKGKRKKSIGERNEFGLEELDKGHFRSIREDGKSLDEFFDYPEVKRRSVSISSRGDDEKETSQKKNVMKVQLNSEYLQILEDVALSKAMEMEEILKISFSPKQQTNLSIMNPRRENNIASTNVPRYCTPRTGKFTRKPHDSKFIDSELEWSPSSLININILVDDKEKQKCSCRKKISSTSIQNSNALSNVLSRKSADLSTKVKDRFFSACKRTCNKVKCNCIRPSNLFFPQKTTTINLGLKKSEPSKKETQLSSAVVFKKLPDESHFHKSNNINDIPICGNLNNIESPNELCEQYAKRRTVDDQRNMAIKHKCPSRKEVKLESRKPDNIDSISFCGNIISPYDLKPCTPYEKRRTVEAQRCVPMKYRCFSKNEMKDVVCEPKNIDAISVCTNIDDSEFSNNMKYCKHCQRSEIANRYFCGNRVKVKPCGSDKIDSITPCGNIDKASSNNGKLCKPCEKTEPVGTQIIHRPFSKKIAESCKLINGDSICGNINKVEFCDDVKIYEPCQRITMVEPPKPAIRSWFSRQRAKSEIPESKILRRNTSNLESCIEAKQCELCKRRKTRAEAQPAISTKHKCFPKEEVEFDSCISDYSQTSDETKKCKCNDLDKNLPHLNEEEMIKICDINQSDNPVSGNCDSSAEKLPLKNCPRIRLSKADQTVCEYENGISPPKCITSQIFPFTAKASVTLQVSQVTINAFDVEEATAKTESALLDEKLCRKMGSPDLTKSCTCTMFSPSFIPIYYANTERISCFSFSEKETCSDEETDYTKSLSEGTDIENNSPQNENTKSQIATGISSIKTNISRQRIKEEERIFTGISGVLNHDTTVFNFIEVLTQSEQKFLPGENKRQFVNKEDESVYSTLDSDLNEYHKKEKVDSVADDSASSEDIERQEMGSKGMIPMSNKKSNKISDKQKMKKKKEFLNNYEKQRSITMRKRLKINNKQTPTSTPSSEKNVKKNRRVISEYLDTSSASILDNYEISNTHKRKFVPSTSKHVMSRQVSLKDRTMSVLRKATTLTSHKKETLYSPYYTNPTLYHVAVESVENINQADASNEKTKFRISFFFQKSKGKIINWFRYLHTTKQNVNLNDNDNGKHDDEADRALEARINLIKQRKILSSKLRQTDSQTSKLYLYNKFYEEKGRTELIISKSEKQPTPVLQEIKSNEIIAPLLEDDLGEEESGGDQKDEEKLAGPSVPSDDSSVLFIKKEVYDRLQRYGKLHYTLYIGEKNELDHISIESLGAPEEKIKFEETPFFASFDLGTKDVRVHVTKDSIDKMEDEELKEAVYKDESFVACQNSQVRLSLMRGAKYLQKLDPTQANIIEIDCSNKLHEIKICYKKIEHSKTCICEYPQVCKNIQLESSDLSSIVIEKIDKILDAREVCENCERCKEQNEVCDDYLECSDEKCIMKRDDYGVLNFKSQFDNELNRMDSAKNMNVEYENISIKSSECCDAVCSKKLEKHMENEEEDNVKTIQFMQVNQRCGFQEETFPNAVGMKPTSELHKEHQEGIYVNEDKEKLRLSQLNHKSQKPDILQNGDLQKNMTSKFGSKMAFRKNENQKSLVSKKKKMHKRNSQRYSNNHRPTLILTLTHYNSILNIPHKKN